MIYLDTHVVVWLYAGLLDKISELGKQLIDTNDLIISPIILLELVYLREAKRIDVSPEAILRELKAKIGLSICDASFETVVKKAEDCNWTRDPFDRIIVAQSMVSHAKLVTKDITIRKHYRLAVWD